LTEKEKEEEKKKRSLYTKEKGYCIIAISEFYLLNEYLSNG